MPEEQAQAARDLMKDPFVTEGYSEADQMAIEKLKANTDIERLVATPTVEPVTVEYNGVKFRVVPFISRPIRHKMQGFNAIANKENATIEDAENALYDTLATLCVDEPYNSRIAWRYVEDRGGNIADILAAVMGAIKARSGAVKDFRPKS